ncbi:signal peptidase II [Algimonas porphyrae]|uniref:Lipoprotein signal peptidase n=1 Tax=Algimonas porphyrae TaxID=1128113 RepID=A0ABQ5V5E3_9PROT|nr:signal peptidase II [Algimonas porphyrae]GLQ21929.1 lipoprotein signal peptidase [Algimonas porphyrae]
MAIRDTIRKIPVGYGLWLPAIIIGADQLSKWGATRLFDLPMNICAINPMIRTAGHHYEVSPILDLSMLCNPGISWGLMQGDSPIKRWALLAVAVIMVIVLYNAMASARDWFSRLSLSLVIGGAIGNAIDRALFGAVTDFLDASDIGFYYVFNIADAAITVGIVGLVVTMLRDMLAERRSARQRADK